MVLKIILIGVLIYLIGYRYYYSKKKRKHIESILTANSSALMDAEKYISLSINKTYISQSLNSSLRTIYQLLYSEVIPCKKYCDSIYPIFFGFFSDKDFILNHNSHYIELMKERYSEFFKNIDPKGFGLTDRQMDAVFSEEDSTQVNAGAGTGKTKIIESKVLHLVKNKGYDLNKILVVTYSKSAQLDMLKRIKLSLDAVGIHRENNELKENITTFHALGKNILAGRSINKNDAQIGHINKQFSILDGHEQAGYMVEAFDIIMDKINPKIDLFVRYYSVPQVENKHFDSKSDMLKTMSSTYVTLLKKGNWNVKVKSFGEFLIANHLRGMGLNVQYEPNDHYYTGYNNIKISYKPDFYLPDFDIYIEYFGVDENGKTADFISTENYVQNMNSKIEQHKKSNNKLIDLRYADLKKGHQFILDKLDTELLNYGLSNEDISKKDMSDSLSYREAIEGTGRILTTFLSLYKESGFDFNDLDSRCMVIDLVNQTRNSLFVEIFKEFYQAYQGLLSDNGYIDFGDMIVESTRALLHNQSSLSYDYILIDEFQDISHARANLINAIRKQQDNCKLLCVGDDWQSIYQFSGSDISIFLDFEKYFGYNNYIILDKTFRFNEGISKISGDFIMMNPDQKTKSLESIESESNDVFLLYTYKNLAASVFKNILKDVIADMEEKNLYDVTLLLLTRNTSGKYETSENDDLFPRLRTLPLEDDRHLFQNDDRLIRIKSMTSHKSKGLEADYVVIGFVNEGMKYNFPSSFDDDPVLEIVNNKRLEGISNPEERRVFYVSLTRGKRKCFIFSKEENHSIFINHLLEINTSRGGYMVTSTDQSDYSRNKRYCPNCCGIMISYKGSKDKFICENYYANCKTFLDETKKANNNSISKFYGICKKCRTGYMVKRKNRTTGEYFLGCSDYPKCKHTNIL